VPRYSPSVLTTLIAAVALAAPARAGAFLQFANTSKASWHVTFRDPGLVAALPPGSTTWCHLAATFGPWVELKEGSLWAFQSLPDGQGRPRDLEALLFDGAGLGRALAGQDPAAIWTAPHVRLVAHPDGLVDQWNPVLFNTVARFDPQTNRATLAREGFFPTAALAKAPAGPGQLPGSGAAAPAPAGAGPVQGQAGAGAPAAPAAELYSRTIFNESDDLWVLTHLEGDLPKAESPLATEVRTPAQGDAPSRLIRRRGARHAIPPRSIVVVTFPMDQAPADGALTLRLARYKTPVRTVLRLHRLDLVIEVAAWRKGPAAFRERLLNPLPELSRRPMVQICATDNGTIRIRPTPARKPEAGAGAGAVSRQTARTSPDIPSSASSRAVSPAPVAYFPPVAAASASGAGPGAQPSPAPVPVRPAAPGSGPGGPPILIINESGTQRRVVIPRAATQVRILAQDPETRAEKPVDVPQGGAHTFQIPGGGVAALTPVRERQAFELEFLVCGAGAGGTPMIWSCAESAGAGASWVSSIVSGVDAKLPAGIEPKGNLLVLGPATGQPDGDALQGGHEETKTL